MKKRLIDIRDLYCGGNSALMARTLGISKTTIQSRLDNPHGAKTKFYLDILEQWPEISAEWLMRGIGPMNNSYTPDHTKQLNSMSSDLEIIKNSLI